ncbi:MAG: proprotein convertase P-domain-containing protein, partial [Candidatus Wallbacteria bacterium]|nr:proprotein convertase P-domain-containing protein [Candidatus Wallbacteria bacterium]
MRAFPVSAPFPRFAAIAILGVWAAACTGAYAGTISGTARFEKRPVTDAGYGTSFFSPCRFNQIEIVLTDNTVLGTSSTDASGNYSVTLPDQGQQTVFLRVYAAQQSGNFRLLVANNNTAQATHTARSQNQSLNTNLASTINIDIPVASAAGAFNIFDQGIKVQQRLFQQTGQVPPRLTFFWQQGTADGTFFQASLNAIFLLNGTSDFDEYDDDVIIHETGHYVEANFSRDDSVGGQHAQSDSHQDLRVAWSEGAAYWWSGAIQNKADQRDITANGVSFFEMETPSNASTATGGDNEVAVESVLWDIFDDASTTDSTPGVDDDPIQISDAFQRMYLVLQHQFGAGNDTTLENFYNGWFREHGATFLKPQFDSILATRSIDFRRPNLFSASPALAIPDAGDVVESTISVPRSISLTGVAIFADVTHRSPTDLVVRIIHPDGTAVTLHNRQGTPGGRPTFPNGRDLFNWYEPNDASPAQSLSAFNGKNGSGTWRLQLQDQVSGNSGQLNRWRLSLQGTSNSPDLIVSTVSGPASGTPGTTIPVASRIENRGTAEATANFTCAYVLSGGRTVATTAVVLGTFAVNGLSAGIGVNDSRNVTLPANTALGQYFIGVVADKNNTVAESDENNNSATASGAISVIGANTPADLVVTRVTAGASSFPGGSLAVSTRIENAGGTGVSASFNNRYILSTDQQITLSDATLATFGVNSLGAGAGFDDSRTVTVPSAIARGSYFVGVIADADNSIPEASDGNNTLAASSQTVIAAAPAPADLSALRVVGPRSASTGATVLVTVTFENAGDSPVTGLFSSGVFLSSDSQIAASDIRLSTFSTNGMTARQRIDRTVPAPIPASLGPGTYFLGLLLDLDNVIAEASETNNGVADTGGVLLSPPPTLPDLAVVNLLAPSQGSLGRSLTLTADVVNNGGTDITATFALRLIVSRTRTPLVAVASAPDVPIVGLASGATKRVSASLTVPATLAAGNYFTGAIADPANVVTEASETNNSFSPSTPISLQLPILADLVPLQMDLPPTGFLGGHLIVRPKLINRGSGASGPFLSEFLLSSSSTSLATAVSLGTASFDTLAPGASRTSDVTLNVPTRVVQGLYHVAIRVDSQNEVDESNETNNTLLTTTTVNLIVPVLPDLTVLSVDSPAQVEAGAQMSVRRSIKNQGNAPLNTSYSEGIVLSTSSTISVAAQPIATFGNQPLPVGGVSTETRLVTVPGTIAPGSYFVGVVADPANSVIEIDESNNSAAALAPTVVSPSQKPDLVLDSVSVPSIITATQPFQLVRTVHNASQFGTVRGFLEVVYLSVDSRITTADTPLASFIGPSLAPGASNTTTRSITLPQNTPGGSFFIGMILDPSGSVDEANRDNNARATASAIDVRGNGVLPDLAPADLSSPSGGTAGSTITVQRRVENLGRGNLISTWDEAYYLSTDALITTTDTRIATFSNGPLATFGVSAESRTLTLPSTIPPGTYFLGIIVDPDNRIIEGDVNGNIHNAESNNSLPSPTPLLVAPAGGGAVDLAPILLSVPREVQIGGQIAASATVENRGTAASTGFDVRFFLSTNRTVEPGVDLILGTLTSGPLVTGARTTLQGFFTIPSNQPVGNYFVLVQADPANRIPEANESNNTLASDLLSVSTTLTLADLLASSLNFSPARVDPRGPLQLSWTVQNTGGRPAPAFKVQFFLSTDTAIGPPDAQLASITLPPLPASQSFSDVTSAVLPAAVTTGAYFVGMSVDGDNQVVEADERNNIVVAPATLAVGASLSGPDLVAFAGLIPTSAVAGGLMPLTLVTKNRGPVNVTQTFVNRVYLSAGNFLDTNADPQIAEYTVFGCPATSETTQKVTARVPRIAPGIYHTVLLVDATDVVREDDETNNAGYLLTQIRGAPDLRPDSFVAPDLLAAGVVYPADFTITNAGHIVATGPILSRILLSFDGTVDSTDLVLKPAVFPGNIAVGAQVSVSTTFAVPAFVSPGTYRLLLAVDPGNSLAEEDESNNTRDLGRPVTVTGSPDLKAVAVSGPAAILSGSGDGLVLEASIQNVGTPVAAASTAGFFLSLDRVADGADPFVGSVAVPSLVPGETAQVEGRFPLPGSFAPGNYFAVVRADLTGAIPETNETDASNVAVAALPTQVLASSTDRPHVTRLSISRSDPAAVGAGAMTITAEYDRALSSAPAAGIDQPGTNDLASTPMSGSVRLWTLAYTVPADNGTFNRDGPNRLTIAGGRDTLGVDAETFTTAAAFISDTIAPVVRLSFPVDGGVAGSSILVSGDIRDASDRLAVTVSADGDVPRQASVSAGHFEQRVTLAGDRPSIVVRCVDGAGNSSADVRVTVQLDSDGDGIPDSWERSHGLNPNDPSDASADPDADGLTNLQEYQAGTDPHNADTNGNGISDSVELAQGGDPVHAGNRPPVARAREGFSSAREAGPRVATLDGTASSDPDGDALRFAWTQVSTGPQAPPQKPDASL